MTNVSDLTQQSQAGSENPLQYVYNVVTGQLMRRAKPCYVRRHELQVVKNDHKNPNCSYLVCALPATRYTKLIRSAYSDPLELILRLSFSKMTPAARHSKTTAPGNLRGRFHVGAIYTKTADDKEPL